MINKLWIYDQRNERLVYVEDLQKYNCRRIVYVILARKVV